MTLKLRFLDAVCAGELGTEDECGVIVALKDFKRYFSDVKTDYINSFLPAAVIETGQYSATHTKFIFRIKKGIYRVHPNAIEQHKAEIYNRDRHITEYKIEECYMPYQYAVMA